MTYEEEKKFREALNDLFSRFPAEFLLGLQFHFKLSFPTARREIRHFMEQAERITGLKLFAYGLIVQGVTRTHVHLLLFGTDNDASGTVKNLPKETIEKVKIAWAPKTSMGEKVKDLDRYLEPIASLDAVSVYLSEPHNIKISSDIRSLDKFEYFDDWNRKYVTRAMQPKTDLERIELKLPPLRIPDRWDGKNSDIFAAPPCFSFVYTPLNRCCFRCGIGDKCMQATRERTATGTFSSKFDFPLEPLSAESVFVPKHSIIPMKKERLESIRADSRTYRLQPISAPDGVSAGAWKLKIEQAETRKHPLYFMMNEHQRDDEMVSTYNLMLRRFTDLGVSSALYRVTSSAREAMKSEHWIHLRRARVWADFFGSRYDDFLEAIFKFYNKDRVKKASFPKPNKLYGKAALLAYQDHYESEFPSLRMDFWFSEEWQAYLSEDLLPENFTGTERQIQFYDRIHLQLWKIAKETRRDIERVIDEYASIRGCPAFRKRMYDKLGKPVLAKTEAKAKSDYYKETWGRFGSKSSPAR